jgi:hypothetical protein
MLVLREVALRVLVVVFLAGVVWAVALTATVSIIKEAKKERKSMSKQI